MFMQKVGFINKARKMHEHVQFIGLHYLRAKKTSINLEMLSNMPGLPIDSVIFKKSSIFVIC